MEAKYSLSPVKATVSFLVAILITILGGALVGVFVAGGSSVFYIVLIFPILMGVAGGLIVKLGVRLAKIRSIVPVIVLAVLVAATIYGTYHFGKYLFFRTQALAELTPKLANVSSGKKAEAVDIIIDLGLEKATGHSGFLGYMLYRAQRGVSIGRFYSGNGLNLGPIFTWVYWMLEFGIIFGVAMMMGKKTSKGPICESCGRWYEPEEHLGGTSIVNESLLLDLLHRRDFVELGKLVEKNATIPSTEMYIRRCKYCGKGNAFVTIQRASQGTNGRLQLIDVTSLSLQPNDSRLLLQNVPVK
jgi:hypothetical protein